MNNMSLNKKEIVFFSLFFIFFFLFYTIFHPAIITTPDDWLYITYTRDALPLWSKHNPTRVLPEILMPVISVVSSRLLMPLGIGFEQSIASGLALFLSCLISLYTFSFYTLVRKIFLLKDRICFIISLFFILFHFWAFRTTTTDNIYLFGALCLTNYYYYTIPILLNATLVMYCMRSGILDKMREMSYIKQGLFYALVYLCLLSNLYSSIIIISYFLLVFLNHLYSHHYNIKECLIHNKFVTFSLLFYVVILCFEVSGGNAQTLMSQRESLGVEVSHTVAMFLSLFGSMNNIFIIFNVIVLLAVFWLFKRKKQDRINKIYKKILLSIIFYFFTVSFFCILISAKSRPYYVTMPDKMLAEFFWIMVALGFSLAFCVKRLPQIEIILPLLFVLLLCHTNTKSKTFEDVTNYKKMQMENARLLSILQQVNETNVDSLTLLVPKMEGKEDNWPYPLYFGFDLSNTFYAHRLTKKRINIDIIAVPGLQHISSVLEEVQGQD